MKKKRALLRRLETVHSESVEYSEMGLKEFIDRLHQINKDAKKRGFEDITIEFEKEWGYYDDQWTNMVIKGKKAISVKEFVEGKQQCIKTST